GVEKARGRDELALCDLVPAPLGEQQREGGRSGGGNRAGEPDPREPGPPAGESHGPEGRPRDDRSDGRREPSPTERESHPRIILPPGLDGAAGKAAVASSRHRKRRL